MQTERARLVDFRVSVDMLSSLEAFDPFRDAPWRASGSNRFSVRQANEGRKSDLLLDQELQMNDMINRRAKAATDQLNSEPYESQMPQDRKSVV